jgi:hypothetical protein
MFSSWLVTWLVSSLVSSLVGSLVIDILKPAGEMLTLEFLLDVLLLNPGEIMGLPELLFDELEDFYELVSGYELVISAAGVTLKLEPIANIKSALPPLKNPYS